MYMFSLSSCKTTILILLTAIGLVSAPYFSTAQKHKHGHQKEQIKPQHAKAHHAKAHKQRVAHHNYKHLPKRGHVVTTLPSGIVKVNHKGATLHFNNGVFYKPKGAASFVVARAPIGLRIKLLPAGAKKIMVRKQVQLHYYYGTFYSYSEASKEYEVVEAPEGAVVADIPDGYEMEEIDGVVYYTLDDAKYMEKLTSGDPVYVVVK